VTLRALWLALVLLPAAAGAAPSQLDRAKQVYAEGKALLDKKNYIDAMSKFEEAYRLAPDKHLFNYNIATAAELAGDCNKALNHYKMFLDLVPDHPQRADAKKSIGALTKSCAPPPSAAEVAEERGVRESERKDAVRRRVLGDALHATQQSVLRYQAVIAKHGKQAPFSGILRQKKRAAKKIAKLFGPLEIDPVDDYTGEVGAAGTVEQSCRQAETQEERNIAVYEKAYETFDDDFDTQKLMDKLSLRAETRHLRAFRDTCPR
jgi:tetratricopeptide (TPR) repeat protein